PDRLALRDADARLAGERGVRIVVSTDAHSTSALDYATLGIGQARRAWLTKGQGGHTHPGCCVKVKKRRAGRTGAGPSTGRPTTSNGWASCPCSLRSGRGRSAR